MPLKTVLPASPRVVTKPAISAYPDDAAREAITRMAAELGTAEGKVLALCAEAVAEMTSGNKLVVPRLVTMLLAIRKHGASMADAPKPWPNGMAKKRKA